MEIETEATVRRLAPDFRRLGEIDARGIIVTTRAETDGFDFVSRYFAPYAGINEDPVTGSAHCCLGPYWQRRLSRDTFVAWQASERGGLVKVEIRGKRVNALGQGGHGDARRAAGLTGSALPPFVWESMLQIGGRPRALIILRAVDVTDQVRQTGFGPGWSRRCVAGDALFRRFTGGVVAVRAQIVQQQPPTLEQVRPCVGGLDPVRDHMGQRRFTPTAPPPLKTTAHTNGPLRLGVCAAEKITSQESHQMSQNAAESDGLFHHGAFLWHQSRVISHREVPESFWGANS